VFFIDERQAGAGQGGEAQQLRGLVDLLAVPRHRVVNARGNARTRELVADSFATAGYDVEISGRFGNVLARPRRQGRWPLRLVAAHYDAVPDCPGADDNASGVAVLLACAHALSGAGHEVGFIAFNGEEEGMLGSRDFVEAHVRALGELEVVHVLEMVGASHGCTQRSPLPWASRHFHHADFLGLLGKGAANRAVRRVLHCAAEPALRVLGARLLGPVDRLLPDLRRSDHVAFWDQGLPAVMWTDTADFRNPHYHRPSDQPSTLDFVFMTRVLGLLIAEAQTAPRTLESSDSARRVRDPPREDS
jgi:Iap family predicted aminopeptidase